MHVRTQPILVGLLIVAVAMMAYITIERPARAGYRADTTPRRQATLVR